MFSSEEAELSALEIAMTHTESWTGLHANQRQNLLNFFLVAVAFLLNAFVGAVASHIYLLADVIGILGAMISVGFTAMDLRNRDLTRAGERAMDELERALAVKLNLESLRIVETVDRPRRPWLSMGKVIRTLHIAVGVVFVGATAYSLSK